MVKVILPSLLIFFIFSFAQAQTYHSFMHETAVWKEWGETICCDAGNNCEDGYGTVWIMHGDTVIGSYTYKKLYFEIIAYSHHTGWKCFCPPFWTAGVFWQQYLFGLIREDSTRKVFLVANPLIAPPVVCSATDFSEEKILYDFNLELGDTAEWKPFNNVVSKIDSVVGLTENTSGE